MKKIVTVLLLMITFVCTFTGCGGKDYSFVQAEWDKNDLSFVETTADPNEANRFIGFFAANHEGYRALFVPATETIPHDYIGVGIRTDAGAIGYDYVILEDKATAKSCYETMIQTDDNFNGEVVSMSYGDKAVKICYQFADESKNYEEHVILDGKCVLRIWPVTSDPEATPITEALMEYLY